MASDWCPARICPSHVIAQAAIISSGILGLLVIGLVCSLAALYRDVIACACGRISPCCRGGEALGGNSGSTSSRTAQEIFDECAALLKDHETSFSSSQTLANDNNGSPEDTHQANLPPGASTKKYPHQILTSLQTPTLRKMLRNQTYLGAIMNLFLLSCASMTFQFYSTWYLSRVLPVSNSTGVKVHRPMREIDLMNFEAPLDVKDVFGLKLNGLAFFLSNGAFVILYLKRKALPTLIWPDWKPWAVPIALLVVTLLACVTGAVSGMAVIVPFLLTACVVSFGRLVEVVLVHTVVAQAVRTWPPVVPKLTDNASTLLWSLIPLSLLLSSAIQKGLHDVTDKSFPAAPIYTTAALTFLAALTLSFFKLNVI